MLREQLLRRSLELLEVIDVHHPLSSESLRTSNELRRFRESSSGLRRGFKESNYERVSGPRAAHGKRGC